MLIMNTDDLAQTGNLLHRAEDRKELNFRDAKGELRSFELILALAERTPEQDDDFSRNGLALYDKDNKKFIFANREGQSTGLFGPSSRQAEIFEQICDMGWDQFSCMLLDETDLRHEIARAGLAGNIDIPAVTRDQAIVALMSMPMIRMDDGKMAFGWNVSMNFNWDKTGHGDKAREFDRSFDKDWLRAMRDDHSILESACEKSIAPYLDEDFAVLECEEMRCTLDAIGANGDRIVMREFAGLPMEFENYRHMRETLCALDEETLGNLWTATQVLRSDFSRSVRAELVGAYLFDTREALESEWMLDHEAELA